MGYEERWQNSRKQKKVGEREEGKGKRGREKKQGTVGGSGVAQSYQSQGMDPDLDGRRSQPHDSLH